MPAEYTGTRKRRWASVARRQRLTRTTSAAVTSSAPTMLRIAPSVVTSDSFACTSTTLSGHPSQSSCFGSANSHSGPTPTLVST